MCYIPKIAIGKNTKVQTENDVAEENENKAIERIKDLRNKFIKRKEM